MLTLLITHLELDLDRREEATHIDHLSRVAGLLIMKKGVMPIL